MARTGCPESDLQLTEVMYWFSDPEKQKAVCKKWLAAQWLALSPSAAWAQEIWTEILQAIRQGCSGGGDRSFTLICAMLDTFIQQHQKFNSRRRYHKRSLRQFLKKALIGHMLDSYVHQFQKFNFRRRLTKGRLRRFLKKAASSASTSALAGCADAINDGRLEQPANVISSIVGRKGYAGFAFNWMLWQFLRKALIGHMLDSCVQKFKKFNFRRRLNKGRLRRFLKKAASSASASASADCADTIYDGRLEKPASASASADCADAIYDGRLEKPANVNFLDGGY